MNRRFLWLNERAAGGGRAVAETQIVKKYAPSCLLSNHILYDLSKSYGVSNESASNFEPIDICFKRFLQ